ncbi:hypothetical protein UF10_04620 [Peptostreptococcus russellii]|uniref:Plasmid replication protein RepL domain-containing protein n=1 Tax=Peptostreptococcus russellii TaxID=215200 RepID=A0A2P7Q1Q5_9FIRM|nr:replication/maintenance protein RepL [Peptostreptococcus russellii]PSJ31895.1 hypothetical protein UF10_04620 [Peptostreptococcus russellii]
MFDIKKHDRKVDITDYTESRNVNYKKNVERFLNVSPKNYIKTMESISSKKAMIPMMLISIMDKDNKINMTLKELSELLDYPKTSLSVLFGEYRKYEFMQKVRNGVYMINPLVSYKGSKYERDKLVQEYSKIIEGNMISRKTEERRY